MASVPVALTIAGFDPSSGAGVTADLQVFAAHGLFGVSAITALTVQSTRGVTRVQPLQPELLKATLEELNADLSLAGIKIGMLGSAATVEVVAEFLESLSTRPCVVLDPVLRSSSGRSLLEDSGVAALQHRLLPLVDIITPNWAELQQLSGQEIADETDATEAMDRLGERHPGMIIVATGGEREPPVDMLRLADGKVLRVPGRHIETTSTHGTGCAFSSALLCGLVARADPPAAVAAAKRFVEGALCHAPGLGHGRGPMNLLWPLRTSGSRSRVVSARGEVL